MLNGNRKKKIVPVIDGVFNLTPQGIRLIGVKCQECGAVAFPKTVILHRPGCQKNLIKEILLSQRGTVKSFTIQRYEPPPLFKSPQPFKPYAIGSIELKEGIEVDGIIANCEFEDINLGMKVETIFYKLYEDDNGNDVVTYAFRPAIG